MYLLNQTTIDRGFVVTEKHVGRAVEQSNSVLDALPLSLYQTVDLKAQSGMVGAIFIAELASECGAIVNPIEKGHPDIVPVSAENATEAELRNYPEGIEVKATLGGVPTGTKRRAGESRIDCLNSITWQAHHREVGSLMALAWDFVGGTATDRAKPQITAVFYTDQLTEDDWGAVSGLTNRSTKVTGLAKSGRQKLLAGTIAMLDDVRYTSTDTKRMG